MALIKTSDLTQRVSFIKETQTKDENGQVVTVPEIVFTCWASVQTQRLSDLKASIGTILEGTLTFIIRYQQTKELSNDMQVQWNGKQYEIITITKGEFAKDFTTIIAKEIES